MSANVGRQPLGGSTPCPHMRSLQMRSLRAYYQCGACPVWDCGAIITVPRLNIAQCTIVSGTCPDALHTLDRLGIHGVVFRTVFDNEIQ
jgi:hypothetical protein